MDNKLNRRRRGSSLILVLTLTAVMAGVTGIVYSYSANQVYQARKVIEMLKARAIAESGLNICYEKLRRDITLASDPGNAVWTRQPFDNGTYQVTPYVVASNRMVLASVGNFNTAQSSERMDLRYYPNVQIVVQPATVINNGSLYGPYTFTYAMYIGGLLTKWNGCGTFSGGNIWVNGPIALGGNAGWGAGTGFLSLKVYSPGAVSTSGSATINANTIQGTSVSGKGITAVTIIQQGASVPALPAVELSPFYQVALINGMVKTNFVVPDGFVPTGGVLWDAGTLSFQGGATGCFVSATGVSFGPQGTVNPINTNWPTIYNRSGYISITGQSVVNGFFYTGGDLSFTGGGAINGGPFIVKGSLNKVGNSDFTESIPADGFQIIPPQVSPQQTTNTPDRLVVTGYQ